MAEYIDREALLELINEDCKYKKPTNEYTRGCNDVCEWAIRTIENMPTADVVPKSEVEELKAIIADHKASEERWEELYSNTKSEVAREIFEEIEKILAKNIGCNSNTIAFYKVDKVDDAIAELEKKYTDREK